MPAPASTDELLDLVRKSGVVEDKRLDAHLLKLRESSTLPADPGKLAALLVQDGLLTNFQCEQLLQGKWRRFHIGKYKVLERLGSGGMGSVFLCEHKFMRRRVAVKVLPTAKAADPSSLERFYREAKAIAALDHPNIVGAYDIDQDENLHFIVMEYVDGASLQDIVRRSGPISLERACHYISQAAQALDHASRAGLVHRDIKPGNVLVDRAGVVKVLDMGLARFFNDEEDMLTRKYDENVLGTADYLAPEQADDSHTVDIRADIYSLGGTFYFLLTGKTPFGEGSVPQKLMWHRTRQPKPISSYRSDVPAAVQSVLDKMMAKDPGERYQQAAEISDALAPWTQTPIAPPRDDEMPTLSPALAAPSSAGGTPTTVAGVSPSSASTRKTWQVTGAPAPKPPSGVTPQAAPAPAPKPTLARATTAAEPPPTLKLKTNPLGKKSGGKAANTPGAIKKLAAPPLTAAHKKMEESAAVDVAADTSDPSAKGDTPPQTPSRAKPSKRHSPPPKPAPKVDWLLLVAAAVAVLVALALLVAAGFWLGIFGRRANVTPTTLKVGAHQSLTSVRAALDQAKPGDRIVLVDKEHRETLAYQGNLTDITIEAAPGVAVVWSPPGNADPEDALLHLVQARDFHIQGIRFDGEGRTYRLLAVHGLSPGLHLETVRLTGFIRHGIVIANCAGTVENPVRLTAVEATAADPARPETAVFFTANPSMDPPANDHIVMSTCKFTGSYSKGPVWFDGKRPATVVGP